MTRLNQLIATAAAVGLATIGLLSSSPAVGAIARPGTVEMGATGRQINPAGGVPATYRVIDLGNLGGTWYGSAHALNDRGEVVGTSSTATGSLHPFLWRDGVMTDLGVLDNATTDYGIAFDINDRGEVVGLSSVAGGTEHAFLWREGTMTDLGTLGGAYSFATAINERGHVVGRSMTASGEYHGFLWVNGVMTDLGVDAAWAINDRGQITGGMVTGDGYHAYRWSRGRLTDLGTTAGTYSQGKAVNNAGWVAGSSASLTLPGYGGAFLYRNGAMTALPDLGGGYSDAVAINDHGLVLGVSTTATPGAQSYVVWRNGTAIDLAGRGIANGGMGIGAGAVTDINNSAQITGSYYFTNGQPGAALFTR